MPKPKIAIIGSTREGRFADRPAAWLRGVTARRADATHEVLDLRDYPMPSFDELPSPTLPDHLCTARRPSASTLYS